MFTIGHSTLSVELFISALHDNGVCSLIDIRTIPKSRHNPQYSQDALASSLRQAGVAYRWQQSLGGLRHPRRDSINLGWRNSSFRGYADYMQTDEFARALDELLTSSNERTTAIMCAEAVPWRCHRSLVADALLARDIPVEDVFCSTKGHSERRPHKLTRFARIEGGRLWYPAENDLFAEVP